MFNGSTFSFSGSSVGKLVGIAYSVGGNWIDVSEPEDLVKLFEFTSQPELSVKLKFKRQHNLTAGDKGTAAILWSDGTTSSCPGTWQVGPNDKSGDWDSPLNCSVELRPTVP
jgi:hypothetical protein